MTYQNAQRLNYDNIAHLYDRNPIRQKPPDPHFLAFLKMHDNATGAGLRALDMGCGTGNQLIANYPHAPEAAFFGLDLFAGMLKHAARKSTEALGPGAITWVQGDNAAPPFPDASFDYISNQFNFHHVRRKTDFLRAAFRLLRPGGRFVMVNIAVHGMSNALIYHYFPSSLVLDMLDFLAPDTTADIMRAVGFANVTVDMKTQSPEVNLHAFYEKVQDRSRNSQLMILPESDYKAGLRRIEADLNGNDGPIIMHTENCLLTITADKT